MMSENLLSGTRCWRGLATKGTEESQIKSVKEKPDHAIGSQNDTQKTGEYIHCVAKQRRECTLCSV